MAWVGRQVQALLGSMRTGRRLCWINRNP